MDFIFVLFGSRSVTHTRYEHFIILQHRLCLGQSLVGQEVEYNDVRCFHRALLRPIADHRAPFHVGLTRSLLGLPAVSYGDSGWLAPCHRSGSPAAPRRPGPSASRRCILSRDPPLHSARAPPAARFCPVTRPGPQFLKFMRFPTNCGWSLPALGPGRRGPPQSAIRQ